MEPDEINEEWQAQCEAEERQLTEEEKRGGSGMKVSSIEFELPQYSTERECCKRCNSLKELWWFENNIKKFGTCCVMLLAEGVVMKIENPESDMCEMFEESEVQE